LQSDLKLKEWLYDAVDLNLTDVVKFPAKNSPNVLSHEVQFELITSGTVSPTWKIVTANPVAVPVTAKRDRTHTLQITMGPTAAAPTDPNNPKKGNTLQLAPVAAAAALAGNIGIAVNFPNNRNQ
jgi:hypothetical protein